VTGKTGMSRNDKLLIALLCTWVMNLALACCRGHLEPQFPPLGVTVVVTGQDGSCFFADASSQRFAGVQCP
jgi:hypothetical protein